MVPTIDRRTTLAWLAAAIGAAPGVEAFAQGGGIAGTKWPEPTLSKIIARGYGTDPDLQSTTIPWPLTMTNAELTATGALCDIILPAEGALPSASKAGVPAFLNEWISAPYPRQQVDRAVIVAGLVWIDAESAARGGVVFAKLPEGEKRAICDRIACKDRVAPGYEKPAAFFALMRQMTLGAYYSTAEGWADIGFLGNQPSTGPYPGPTPEAAAHIARVIGSMGLSAA